MDSYDTMGRWYWPTMLVMIALMSAIMLVWSRRMKRYALAAAGEVLLECPHVPSPWRKPMWRLMVGTSLILAIVWVVQREWMQATFWVFVGMWHVYMLRRRHAGTTFLTAHGIVLQGVMLWPWSGILGYEWAQYDPHQLRLRTSGMRTAIRMPTELRSEVESILNEHMAGTSVAPI